MEGGLKQRYHTLQSRESVKTQTRDSVEKKVKTLASSLAHGQLKGQFIPKLKIHLFPVIWSTIYQSRLF